MLVFAVLAWYHAAGDIIESTFGLASAPGVLAALTPAGPAGTRVPRVATALAPPGAHRGVLAGRPEWYIMELSRDEARVIPGGKSFPG